MSNEIKNQYLSRKVLGIIEGIITLFVLVITFADPIFSNGIKIGLASAAIILSIIFLICRWIIRAECNRMENFYDAIIGLFLGGVSLYCLVSIM